MPTNIVPVRDEHLDWCLRLNNSAVPDVGTLDRPAIGRFATKADYFRVAEVDGEMAGMLIALSPGHDYESLNYRWFEKNFDDFVYIDRVIVAPAFRGRGVGNIFYADVQSFAEQRAPYLTCEVNLEPRNDVSLLFHGTHGFEEVGQQTTENGAKRVSLLAKPLPSFEFVRERYPQGLKLV